MTSQLKSMKDQFNAVMEEAKAMAFIKILDNHPDATMKDMAALVEGCDIGSLTLGQLFLGKTPATAKGWLERLTKPQKALMRAGKKKRATRATKNRDGKLNLQRSEDQEAYENSVVFFLQKAGSGWKYAREIREACGGSALQARSALNRLIQENNIEFAGRTRGTRYKAI